jgi:hypothetical protein
LKRKKKTKGVLGDQGVKIKQPVPTTTISQEGIASRKPLRRFGINFRHRGHYFWFLVSTTILLASVVASGVGGNPVWISMAGLFFLQSSLAAVFDTRMGTRETRLFSVDCIWFNGLMGGICIFITKIFF